MKAIILKKSKPSRIWLYGSEANGESSDSSDIDIAYLDTHDERRTQSNVLSQIRTEIDEIKTLVKIDVANIAIAEERFSLRVKTTGKVLFSATKPLRAEDAIYNYSKALAKLEEAQNSLPALVSSGLEDVYLDLIVKRFEFTYEMSWKAIKRVLSMLGLDEAKSPRACFKEAFAQGLLTDQNIWLDMIEMRILSSHTYDELEIQQLKSKLPAYTIAFKELVQNLNNQMID